MIGLHFFLSPAMEFYIFLYLLEYLVRLLENLTRSSNLTETLDIPEKLYKT